jgi:hypothetical protein
MAESPNLGIVHVEQFQSSKHTTVNAGFDRIDNSLHQETDVAMSNGVNALATADFQANGRFDLTGALTAVASFDLPAGISRWFFVRNSTTGGEVVTVQVTSGGGIGVAIDAGTWYILYTDATDVTMISKSSPNLVAYSGYAVGSGTGVFGSAQTLMRTPMAFDITFPVDFAGAFAVLGSQTTGSTTFDVKKAEADGTGEASIGSIIFGATANEATFTTATSSEQPLTAGQILMIIAPGSADASADELGFTLVAGKDI